MISSLAKRNDDKRKESGKKEGKMTTKRKVLLKKAMAYLTELSDEDDDEEPREKDDEDGEEDVQFYGVVRLSEEESTTVMKTAARDDELFIIDSGCKGAHICRDPSMLEEAQPQTKTRVQGITGHSLLSTHTGYLPNNLRTRCRRQPIEFTGTHQRWRKIRRKQRISYRI